jgi:hypothetical protein
MADPRSQMMGVHAAFRLAATSSARVFVAAFDSLRPCLVFVQVAGIRSALPARVAGAAHLQERLATPSVADSLAMSRGEFLAGQGCGYTGAGFWAAIQPALSGRAASHAIARHGTPALQPGNQCSELVGTLGATSRRSVALDGLSGVWMDAAIVAVKESCRLSLDRALSVVRLNGQRRRLSASTLAKHTRILSAVGVA